MELNIINKRLENMQKKKKKKKKEPFKGHMIYMLKHST